MLVKPSIPNPVETLAATDFVGPAELLADLLGGGSTALRRQAAHNLRDYPECGPQLCDILAEEPRASVRAAILNTLIRLRSADVIRGLVEHLRSENATLRNEVIEVLQDMPDEAMPILEQLLTDWDSDVRIFTANILSETKHPRTPDVLIGVIKSDPHVNVCMAALDGLLEIGDESMIDSIQQLGERFPEAPFVKFAVSLAIKRLQGVDYARGTT